MRESEKKAKLILKHAREIETGMFTSTGSNGLLATRPMHLAHVDEDKRMWFFTRIDSAVAMEIEEHSQVSVGFSCPEKNLYVAVSGAAKTVIDSEIRSELWTPLLRSWFPKGVSDPECILICVTPHVLESWDGPAWRIVQLTEQIVAIALGKQASSGEHVSVQTA